KRPHPLWRVRSVQDKSELELEDGFAALVRSNVTRADVLSRLECVDQLIERGHVLHTLASNRRDNVSASDAGLVGNAVWLDFSDIDAARAFRIDGGDLRMIGEVRLAIGSQQAQRGPLGLAIPI